MNESVREGRRSAIWKLRSTCVERLEPIVENSACVEAGTTIPQTPAKRCQFEQFQLYYLRRGEISGIEVFQLLDTSYVRATRSQKKKEKQKIELAKLQLAKLEKEIELQRAKNKALSLNPAAKVEEKQFETLNKETATHIGIREAEDWFRPIDLAKECDIYISSRSGSHKEIPITYEYIPKTPLKIDHKTLNQRLKRTIPNILKEKIKIAIYAVIHLITQETVRSVLNLKNLTTTSIIE
ncbi:hypothetical protein TNCV_775581 [Trichonephila clavipes]|nr:hypothetical protein TNCV_775581 [Trichonephila clavipes]